LAAETVEGASLALERVDHIHGRHSLSLGVLGVGNSISDHVLQEDLQHTARFFIDQTRNALDAATASQTADGWFGDALDVVAQHLAVALSASFAEPLPAFA
ncbi:hypothetical protein N307_06726, partial [Dryobates pubescens]